jgi:molybdopterin molybdotransferase
VRNQQGQVEVISIIRAREIVMAEFLPGALRIGEPPHAESAVDQHEPGTVLLPRAQAGGLVLAEAIMSSEDIPPFDNSAMDGYAVRVADLSEGSLVLQLSSEVRAGQSAMSALRPGTCARIMTGAPVPPGCDAVVPVEWTDGWVEAGPVAIHRLPVLGQNIRRAGRDIGAGDTVFGASTVVTPPVVGMLAALGKREIRVVRRPTISVVATGDELVGDGEALKAGQIRNSNGPGLVAQSVYAGGEVILEDVARDDADSVRAAIRRGLAADILLVAGGVSVGLHDHVRAVLESEGIEILFRGVRQRPGKPLVFGRAPRCAVFGLPGNPVSSAVCFEQYVRPAIRRFLGYPDERGLRDAVLEEDVVKRPGLHYFSRGVVRAGPGNTLTVALAGEQGSNIYSSMVRSNCIVHLPEGRDSFGRGEVVSIEPYAWTHGA